MERTMSRRTCVLAAAAMMALAMGVGAQGASAWDPPAPWPGALASKPVPLYDSAPGGAPGYEVVESGTLTDWAGIQTHDELVCPAGKLPVGGGAQLYSSSLAENLASSYPTTQGWAVDVNNATTTDGLYDLYAVCANPKGYVVHGYGPFLSRAGHGGAADDGCTTGTKVLGGGARTHTTDVSVGLQQSFPLPEGLENWAPGLWQIEMTNPTSQDLSFDEFVICGKVKHSYQVVKGTSSVDRAGTREQINVYCPSGTRPLGGGVQATSIYTGVTLNSSFPWPTGWSGIENNTSSEDAPFSDSVVCE
jgi:hypothetical protein